MKFNCNQHNLSKAINIVSKAVAGKTTMPILNGILLILNENGDLTMKASDLDITIEKTIKVNCEEAGSIVVPARLFGDIIRKLPEENLVIEVKNNNLMIKSNFSEFNIITFAADEFPNLKEEETDNVIKINKEIFKNMIQKTYFCAHFDETKGVIVGIYLEFENNQLNMVALDGFRMAVTSEYIENSVNKNMLINAKLLNELSKIIDEKEDDEDLVIKTGKKSAVFEFDETLIKIRLMEGEFIKYKDILPTEKQTTLNIDRKELLTSIERASLLTKEGKNNLIRVNIEENLMTIDSNSEEGRVKEEIIIEKEGENIEIGFNSKYIIDTLKAVDDEELIFEMNTPITPCLIRKIDGENFKYLILPVRITSR